MWDVYNDKLCNKVNMFKAAVLKAPLYGCETWTTYRQNVKMLEQFQQRLHFICGIKWQDRVSSNLEVLHQCDTPSIESHIIGAQLHWDGHLLRVEDHRVPKSLLFDQLENWKRSVGEPRLYTVQYLIIILIVIYKLIQIKPAQHPTPRHFCFLFFFQRLGVSPEQPSFK